MVASAIAAGVLSYFLLRAWTPVRPQAAPPPAQTALVPAEEAATESAIRFYSERVRRDPEDIHSQNALAEYYLQRVRSSGNEDYLPLALAAARASLNSVEAGRNIGGLAALAHAELANHSFAEARAHALELTRLQPSKSEPYAILGDANLELGNYDEAAAAFREMQSRSEPEVATETRLARLAFLRGSPEEARQHFAAALALLLAQAEPPNETIAWCRWQLGETAFALGEYPTAEHHYRQALETAPNYFRALGAMGRVRAAVGDVPAAIRYYEEATRVVPVADFMAALGDLYQLSGRTKEAAVRYELVEQLGEHSRKVHGTPFDRRVALFYADHDVKTAEGYALARAEWEAGRRDIYGADALAWTALKSGHIPEAQAAMNEALRLGTRDARLFYHAGMIAHAAGDESAAAVYLERALALNPQFDPMQSLVARKVQKALEP